MMKRSMESSTPASMDELLDQIVLCETGMPVRAMERVLAHDADAVPAIVQALEFWDGDAEADTLWLIVLLGETRSPLAVPALIGQLRRTEADVLAHAAIEALAKIGAPAVPALRDVVASGDADQRLCAYAALGWIDADDAYRILEEALVRDLELADVLGIAITQHAGRASAEAVFTAYRSVEPWQRASMEEAVRAAHRQTPPKAAWWSDWRLRYRRRPDYFGGFHPEWPGLVAALRQEDAVRAATDVPLRSLDEILAAPDPDSAEEPELCDDCGDPIERPMAVPMCPGTAVAVALDQLAVLMSAREDGIDDVFQLLDELEEEEFALRDEPEPKRARAREEREELLLDYAEARATCEWLIEQGVEDVQAGRELIARRAAELGARHGDPDGLLRAERHGDIDAPTYHAPPAPVRARAPKVGRNDACPCGSGRKYKRCCLDADEHRAP
jgi:hypothetical protein